MNSRQFLLIGGIILVVVGLLGFAGILGPTAERSIFGSMWWFDNAENVAHLVLGVVALLLLAAPASLQRPVVIVVGALAVLVGLYNFASDQLLGANLENPADMVLHLVVGIWALFAGLRKGENAMTQSAPMPGMASPGGTPMQ